MICEEASHDCRLCRVELEHVSVTLGGDALLTDVSMHIHCGQLTALVGRNGAGKTTLIRALLGLVPYTGKIRHVDASGRDLSSLTTGYVPQQLPFDREMPLSVCDLIAATLTRVPVWLGVGKKVRQSVHEILTAARAEDLIDKRLGALSGGEIQRVLLAMALSPMPDLLVLDEPVSGVDQNGLQLFLDTVSELRLRHHMAILLVSHDWALVRRYADSAALIDKRVLRVGTTDEVFSSDEFSQAFPHGNEAGAMTDAEQARQAFPHGNEAGAMTDAEQARQAFPHGNEAGAMTDAEKARQAFPHDNEAGAMTDAEQARQAFPRGGGTGGAA